MKKIIILSALVFIACNEPKSEEKTKVSILLDWLPNTNHTGLYVAKELGFIDGVELEILPAAEESTSDMVISGKVPFGIYFQDYLGQKLARGAKITAVAAIIHDNTSGFIANSSDFAKLKSYGTYNYPIELAMMREIFSQKHLQEPKIVPNDGYSAVLSIKNKMFDFTSAFYAYDGVFAKLKNANLHFFYYKDLEPKFNFYTPVIIANDEFLAKNKELSKKIISGICKGYKFAAKNPQKASEILLKQVPSLQKNADFIRASQEFASSAYLAKDGSWGKIDKNRWNNFYSWVNENVKSSKIPLNLGFSNEFLDCE